MRSLKFGILFVALLTILACDDSKDFDYGDFLETFATYNGESDGKAVFSGQAHDDSPLLTLYAAGFKMEGLKAGERIYIRYTVTRKITDSEFEVTVNGASPIISGKINVADPKEMETIASTPFTVTSVWRTGNYINFNLWVPYVGGKFGLDLIADKSDVDSHSATVKIRIVYDTKNQEPAFERKCYASFDISEIWSQPECKRVRVYTGDFNDTEYYEFNK